MHDSTIPPFADTNDDRPTHFQSVRAWFEEEPRRLVFPIAGLLVVLFLLFAILAGGEKEAPAPQPLAFVVEHGKGLSYYTGDDMLSIAIAEEGSMPLYAGRQMRGDARITPDQARERVPFTNERQITVGVLPGTFIHIADRSDPATWVIDPPPTEANFP